MVIIAKDLGKKDGSCERFGQNKGRLREIWAIKYHILVFPARDLGKLLLKYLISRILREIWAKSRDLREIWANIWDACERFGKIKNVSQI